jgi:hypothetical protein
LTGTAAAAAAENAVSPRSMNFTAYNRHCMRLDALLHHMPIAANAAVAVAAAAAAAAT